MKDPFPPCPDTIVKAVTPICETLGFTTLPKHFHEVVGAFLLYHVTNVYLSPLISPLLFPKTYRSFNKRNRINWDIHVVSLVQSTLICIVSLYAMFVDRERSEMDAKQRVWGYTGLLGMTQAFGAGYFLWDLMRPFVNYYAPTFLLYELSSPFLNFHWFMDKLEMTGSTLQLVNGICLLVVFFSCRLVYGTYSSFRVGSDIYLAWQNPPRDIVQQGRSVPAWLALSYVTSNLVLHFLNFYWFGKMVDALRRRFDSTKSTVSSPEKKGIVVTEDEVSVEGTDLKIPTSSALHQSVARHRR
ncbi:hypothetical protein TWF703_003341 [Orbilia oligospora]|uniref:TLC domain-containing protein n=1 Tax=Orbilia oligospora TaxID=2813651 RepID=A0A7C8NCN0_ORBOL|nr:hypothetical protein TWF703_003341 [Orbilia oligospora]